jgi:3-oxoacyl-[acyl-carrier-protein] synthase II
VLALRDGLAEPTLGYEAPDPDIAPGLDLVADEPRVLPGGDRVAFSNSFGFGGHDAVLCPPRLSRRAGNTVGPAVYDL